MWGEPPQLVGPFGPSVSTMVVIIKACTTVTSGMYDAHMAQDWKRSHGYRPGSPGWGMSDDELKSFEGRWPDRMTGNPGLRRVPDDEEDEDAEDERGPEGSKMPRADDLPSYTLVGQFLKRFR